LEIVFSAYLNVYFEVRTTEMFPFPLVTESMIEEGFQDFVHRFKPV